MKKAIITIISVFAVLFCLVSLILPRYKAELYSLMYPQNVSVKTDEGYRREVQLKNGDFFVLGGFYGENIVWEAVDCDNEKIAWSKNAICFRSFDDNSSDWHKSELKKWLNDETENGFLSENNFTSEEKNIIFSAGNEGVFVLSEKQLKNFSEEKRAKAPTVSAVKNDGSDKLVIRKNCWYWTSSPINTNASSVTAVTQTGGFYKTLSNDGLVGVCPAFRLSENKVTVCGGDGTAEKPYIITAGGELQ